MAAGTVAAGAGIRGRVALALALLAGALALSAATSEATVRDTGDRGLVTAGPGAPSGTRLVSARMFQNGLQTALGETPQSFAAALASLRPTYVAAPLRFKATNVPTAQEIAAWNTIVSTVRKTSPQAKFSVELNALQYGNIARLNAKMAQIRAAVHPDGWLFDFYSTAAERNPNVMRAAVANAHGNGEFVGGNAFGLTSNPKIPAGTDYVAVQDHNFTINLSAVQDLAKTETVFFTVNNNPQHANSDGCEFINGIGTPQRAAYLTKRAHQQAANHFRFSYPVFFPECERNRQNPKPQIYTYDAPSDTPMMTTIGNLLNQFE